MLGNDSIHAGIAYSATEVEDFAKLIEEAVLVLTSSQSRSGRCETR